MSSKNAATGTKRKTTKDEPSKLSKLKLPNEFIVRPLPQPLAESHELQATVIINAEVCKGLELGSMCVLSKPGENGIVALVKQGDHDTSTQNVIMIPDPLRKVGNLLLGDRVEISKLQSQPPYASSITLGSAIGLDLTATLGSKLLEKLVNSVGLIMPGMVLSEKLAAETDSPLEIIVIDVNWETLPDIAKLTLTTDFSIISRDVHYISEPVLFKQGKTKVILTQETQPNKKYNLPQRLDYDMIGGLKKEVQILKNAVELPLHQPHLFADFGVPPPRGILLHGPPGTGKTMLLRCVAQSTNAHILTINGPSIVSKYLGETEATLRNIFNEAKAFQPSIIFIDEIDSLAPNRSSDESGEVESRVVATLLTLMDGMGQAGKLVVVGATNRPNFVDPALRRPGRFDQEVEIGIPNVEGREDILRKQIGKMSAERNSLTASDIRVIASKTHGYVGADLTGLCREAVMLTIQRGLQSDNGTSHLKVTLGDVEEAMLEIRPSAMREIFLETPEVRWSDIGGQEDLKLKLKEMVQLPLEAIESFNRLGVKAPKGILLYGPPGCSKTMTAKALATESGLNFLLVKGPEIFNKYVGESEKAVREIFRKAKAAAPSIVFFDEIDALSPDRSSGEGTTAASHVLTSLLNEMDGVEELNGVVVVAATNRPDEIDAALLRPGRFDRHVYVGPPDYDARIQIMRKSTAKFSIDETDVDIKALAQLTEGCSGAEVVQLCYEAGLAAITENLEASKVWNRHFQKALQSLSRNITPAMLEYYKRFADRGGI